MNISVILAHPRPGSFNHALAETAAATLRLDSHTVVVHDLCAERFDPLLLAGEIGRDAPLPPGIAVHCSEIAGADGIIVVHPDWWGMPPAILKGWIDRVLRPGVAYRFAETDSGEGIPIGLLKAKAVIVFNTANTPAAREQEVFGDPLERIWKDCIVSFCGVPVFHRRMFSVVVTSTADQRAAWLDDVRQLTSSTFPRT
jgi:putative NADPH-quinone reductase